ncbi:biotin carboxylase N-terminal domain-containing protein [Specibacter cremeus]|uniref:ATP-binding protein n=1 Tax=Specibacter cremeus TaxID=1629051 RepID=UPI000F76CBD7|nr:biotin carboxylase N-terminal domain-containing protein [Specibacter cremeus]
MFNTVLVANRGEIACRVIRTLRALGVRSVAVYSEADAGARHVAEADTAVCIGPAPAVDSYLNIAAVLDACRRTGAQAVHPGYGFLSENADFARALADAGIAFIGPPVGALDVMGDKIRSKNHVAAAGVPVTPGISRPGLTDADLLAAADGIGYPLLIKPSAGGGGKGMHAVHAAADLPAALATARRVAAAAFGDDTLFLERLITAPRHIEVQVLADGQGNVIHLGERECSLQRRHQKVIEEAPSPLLDGLADDGATRRRIGAAACAVAASVGYTGAGTVEFLVSDDAPEEFFFMEMNTRLQVEHPVTELVTGIDLVEWQVRIAAGEELTLRQDDVVLNGHAVEARVYAENPEHGFLPTTGTIAVLDESVAHRPGVRVDSSLLPGLEVSPHYDPMLAKVVAWAPGRATALDTLDAALADYVVLGVDTNIEYLRLLLADPDVRAGRLDTTLIERKLPGFAFRHTGDADHVLAALLLRDHGLHGHGVRDHGRPGDAAGPAGPWRRRDGWRLGDRARWHVHLDGAGRGKVVTVGGTDDDDGTGRTGVVRVGDGPDRPATLTRRGDAADLDLAGVHHGYRVAVDGQTVLLGAGGWSTRLAWLDRDEVTARMLAALERDDAAADPQVRSPMPGTVVSVSVTSGEAVAAGTVLLAVEAMKMEHQLVAALDGTVQLSVGVGALVKADQVVAVIHPTVEEQA